MSELFHRRRRQVACAHHWHVVATGWSCCCCTGHTRRSAAQPVSAGRCAQPAEPVFADLVGALARYRSGHA